MKNRILLGLLFLALSSNIVLGQTRQIGQLIIGDQLPDMELTYTQNGKQQTINSKDLKGKLVILDFWNIWCSSCIEAMPKMLGYQKEFGEDLQVIYVTENSKQQIEDHFSRVEKRSNGSKIYAHNALRELPSIIYDKSLSQMFPSFSRPHTVWIKDGKVKFITSGGEVTSSTIKDVIDGKQVKLVEKKDVRPFDHSANLYAEGNSRLLKYLKYYSMIYKTIPEWGNSYYVEISDTVENVYTTRQLNNSIAELYVGSLPVEKRNKNWDMINLKPSNRTLLEVADSSKFLRSAPRIAGLSFPSWAQENLHCFEMAIPLSKKNERTKIAFDNLNNFFPCIGSLEKRRVKCLALVRTGKNDSYVSNGKSKAKAVSENGREIMGGTMNDLVSGALFDLNSKISTPIIDDTGYNGKIDITVYNVNGSLESIKAELNKFGLDLVEKEMEIEMLVIRDKK